MIVGLNLLLLWLVLLGVWRHEIEGKNVTIERYTIWGVRIYVLGVRAWDWRWKHENHARGVRVKRYAIVVYGHTELN